MSNKIKVYLASGWFTPRTKSILDNLETLLSEREEVDLFSPRRDGVLLPPNQKHDTSLRESIFQDNLNHILNADLVIANIDSVDSYNDTGTIYEVGYAMANDISVVGFTLSRDNIEERFKGILEGFDCIFESFDNVNEFFDELHEDSEESDYIPPKVLFIGAGNSEVDKKIASYISDSGYRLRWINENSGSIYSDIENVFDGVDFMIAVIDDRKTLVSWMLGQAYSRKIPIVTYSDHNYGVNVMLLMSLRAHLKGETDLVNFLQKVKRNGLDSIPKLDTSDFASM